jgi:hypothetical protein
MLAGGGGIWGAPIPREEPDSPVGLPVPSPRGRIASAPEIVVSAEDGVITQEDGVITQIEEPAAEGDAMALFDELGWEAANEAQDDSEMPWPPPSSAIAVPPHRPPTAHAGTPEPLASVIVDLDPELAALLDRLLSGGADEHAEGELLRQGERAMRVLMARFPGPVTFDRSRIGSVPTPPRPSECGLVMRLVVRERKVALPFVLDRLNDADPEVRGWATHLLCELPYAEAIYPLLLRLRDADAATRASAVYALAAVSKMFPDEVRAALAELSRSSDPQERASAVGAMRELREPSVVPDLVRALGDGDERVVRAAHDALTVVTRQDLGADARPWLRWWEQNAARHRIEWLIDALTHEVSEIRRAAGDELRAVTKEYFGYASDLPARDRERAQQRYRDWWITEGRARFRRR